MTSTTKGSIESVADVLTEAYHLVFDVKDACETTSDARYLAYEACSKIAALMSELGFDAPARFDGQGRPAPTTRPEPIAATKIEFTFSEAPELCVMGPFEGPECWAHANRALRLIPPPTLGYYKTDFVVTWADGNTYEGRYDIGDDAPTLEQHIIDHLTYFVGSANQQFMATYKIGPA